MPRTESQILQEIETARLKKKYSCAATPRLEDSFIESVDEYKEKRNALDCMMLKMKYDALAVTKQNSQKTLNLTPSASDSPDVGNASFKILSSRNVQPLKLTDKINNTTDTDNSPKKKTKTKMSRLSLKRMLNAEPNAVQSNLNRFLDIQSKSNIASKSVIKLKKNKNSTKNLVENNKEINDLDNKEQDKIPYKISSAIFGAQKSKNKNECSDNKLKKKVRKKESTENSSESVPKLKFKKSKSKQNILEDAEIKKIELTNKFDDKLDEKLQQGLEMEVEHSDIDVEIISAKFSNKSPEPKCAKFSLDLSSENNLELELIASKSKTRKGKCKSLELAKHSPITPKKVRFSNEIKSMSSEKKFKRTPSYKTLPGYSVESSKLANKDAFKLLMDVRNNVIGLNSPGKVKNLEENSEEKIDLTNRKSMFQEWADRKGNTAKRKLEHGERGEYIDFTLEKRAKRLKKLLNCDKIDNTNIVISDSEEIVEEKLCKNDIQPSKYIKEMSKDINFTDTNLNKKPKKKEKNNLATPHKDKIHVTTVPCVQNKSNPKESLNNDAPIVLDDDLIPSNKSFQDINFTDIGTDSANKKLNKISKKPKKKEENNLATPHKDKTNVTTIPCVQNKSNPKRTSNNDVQIIIDDDLITSKKSFPIFGTAKSSPKKPLQQTLLFCISNIDKSSNKEEDSSSSESIVIVKPPSPKKKIKNKGKLSLKNNKKVPKDIEEIKESIISNEKDELDNNTKKKSSKNYNKEALKDIEEIKESISNEKDELVNNTKKKSRKKLSTARKNGIIDSDDSSRDSITSKSDLSTDKTEIKNPEDLICTKVTEVSKKEIPDTVTNSTKESVQNNDASTNLRRSSRVKKPIEHLHDIVEESDEEVDVKSKKTKSKIQSQKDAKIASVFLKAVPKPKVDPAIMEARRNFLHSASPIKLKETISGIENSKYDPFPNFSHTLQKTDSIFWNLPSLKLKKIITPTDDNMSLNLNYQLPLQLGSFTSCQVPNQSTIKLRQIEELDNKKSILLDIKSKNPDYPVYKIYKLLKLKNKQARVTLPSDLNKTVPKKLLDDSCLIVDTTVSEDSLHFDSVTLWTDKYKPSCSEDIIGNRSSAVDLLKFLKERVLYCNDSNNRKKHKTKAVDNSDDDFVSSDDDNSNSKDSRLIGNTMLLRGPHGSGKTSSVYAVCQELDINVLELNASSKRTGRILLQKLQEATQSQQIHSQEIGSQTNKMCLLLVEDIDVVFEQDDGFINALLQLLQTSKRPIILTFTDDTNPNVQKFLQQYPVITYSQLSAKTCSVWLQLVCLLENLLVDEESLGELLEWNKGDLRRTVLELQFWALTGGDSTTKLVDSDKNRLQMLRRLSADDTINVLDDSITSEVNERHRNVVNSFYVEACLTLGQIWWNFGKVLQTFSRPNDDESEDINTLLITDETPDVLNTLQSKKYSLKSLATFYESLSISDCLYNKNDWINEDLEPTFTTFETKLKNSLCLEQSEDHSAWEKYEIKGMTEFLVHRSFNQLIDGNIKAFRYNMSVPEATHRRWRCKQHNIQETFSDKLPMNVALHRKHFALDYFPMLISIVKIEQTRLKLNAKRRNRFYSYLRNLDFKFTESHIKCLNTAFDVVKTGS